MTANRDPVEEEETVTEQTLVVPTNKNLYETVGSPMPTLAK